MARKPKAQAEAKAAPAANNRPKRKAALAPKKPEIVFDEIDKPRPAVKRSRKVTGKKSHPTYERMIMRAIRTLNKGEATSIIAISNYIFSNYPVPEDKYKRYIKVGLSKGLKNKNLVKVRGSYRLSAKARDIRKRKNKSEKKEEGAEKPKRERSASPKKKAAKKDDASKRKKKKKTEKEEAKPKRARKSKEENNDNNNKKEAPASPKKKRESKKGAAEEEKPAAAKVKGTKYDHFWQFKQDNGIWGNYEVNASDTIEDVYQKYLANRGDNDVRAVKSGQWEYQVDFMAMKQTNIQHPNHTVRDIRRVPVAN
jgi:hypothetical protein